MRFGCTGGSFRCDANFARQADFALCMEGCAAASGRSYYVTGPALDVPGRPDRREGVLARSTDGGKCETTLHAPLSECETQANWLRQGGNSMTRHRGLTVAR
jgi:hypothetical protein